MTRKRYIKLMTALIHHYNQEGKLDSTAGKALADTKKIKQTESVAYMSYANAWKYQHIGLNLDQYGLPIK